MPQFDKTYWEDHWAPATAGEGRELPVNPYLSDETIHLSRGTALDAGCGTGTEALWLAEQGWTVTGADISASALAAAAGRAAVADVTERVEWVEADLTRWEPDRRWDLVTTHYAHPEIGQLAFYQRLATWVAPGGTLLIVGHLHGDDHHGHAHPEDATATLDGITGLFTTPAWQIDSGYENTRTVHADGQTIELRDVIVRAHRIP